MSSSSGAVINDGVKRISNKNELSYFVNMKKYILRQSIEIFKTKIYFLTFSYEKSHRISMIPCICILFKLSPDFPSIGNSRLHPL